MNNGTTWFSTLQRPLVIGHRGVSGHALENSLDAFMLAVDNPDTRCDGVELDIHTTRDRELVVHHDPVLPGGVVIAESSWALLRTIPLANGRPLPHLGEALALAGRLRIFVEAKGLPPAADRTLLRLIADSPAPDQVHVHAFDHRIVARLRSQASTLSCGVLSASYPVDPLAQVRAAGADTLWQEGTLIDEALAGTCREARIALIAWTVNDAPEAGRLRALGVTGLCGNWPERLRD